MKSLLAFAVVSAVGMAALWSIWSGSAQTGASYQERHAAADLESLPVSEIEDQTFVFTRKEPGAELGR